MTKYNIFCDSPTRAPAHVLYYMYRTTRTNMSNITFTKIQRGIATTIDAREGITARDLSESLSINDTKNLCESGFGHCCGYQYTTNRMMARELNGKWLSVLPRRTAQMRQK